MEPDPLSQELGAAFRRFSPEDPLRVEIYTKLRNLVGPGPARFYRDACRLLSADEPVDTVTHLVGHCVREIESALRKVLKSSVVAGSEEAQARRARSGKENNNHDTDIRACLAALEIGETEAIAQAWLTYAGRLHEMAHRDALNPPRPLDGEFIEFFGRMESVLRLVLRRFETKFGSSFPLIDELLAREAPTSKDAERFKNEVPNTLVTHYRFFEGIPDGRWLGPLEEEGLFSSPPGPEISGGEGRETGYPPWPQSRYLARITSHEPARVKDIFLGLPATGNVRVYEDMARAAQEMPAGAAAELAPKITEGLDSPYFSTVSVEAAEAVARLATGGQPDAALELATHLLALVADSAEEPTTLLATLSEPRPRFEPPEYYREVLDTCVEPLVDGAGERTVGMLCGLLAGALHTRRDLDDEDDATLPYEDGLYMDRPAIEDHVYNKERGLTEGHVGRLLAAVRDAAERLCEQAPEYVGRLVERMEARGVETFDRLALHLLRLYPDAPGARESIAERLTAKAANVSPGLFHEYALLLREWFPALPESTQSHILGSIEQGPPPEELQEVRERRAEAAALESAEGMHEEEAHLDRYRERWTYKRLAILDDLLPGSARGEYERLTEIYADPGGNPLFYDEPRVRAIGAESPKSAGELAAMEPADIVSFLEDFEPGDGWDEPDLRDVGQALRRAAASQPAKFSAAAELFEGLDMTYVAELVGGLHESLREQPAEGEAHQRSVEWGPLLKLCGWIASHARSGADQGDEGTTEGGTSADMLLALKQTAMLVQDGLLQEDELPFELRREVWAVLEPMVEHPEPTGEYEEEQLSGGRPPVTPNHLSINTVRGVAVHSNIAYARWVRRNLGANSAAEATDGEPTGDSWHGLDDCPEAKEVLNRHLDPDIEPTRTVRSVYGSWLPALVALDKEWVAGRLPEILPENVSLGYLNEAAWEAYVVRGPVYDDVFDLLRAEYRRAVGRIGERPAGTDRGPHDPDEALAEHLMVLYWRGKVNLGDSDGLLERFYLLAPDSLRGRAAGFIGRVMHNTEPSAETATRLEDLWDWRLQAARESMEAADEDSNQAEGPPGGFSEELGAFGWWLVSSRLDTAGALERMERGLALGGEVGQDAFKFASGLAEVASEQPLLSVRCLQQIIDGVLGGDPGLRWQLLSINDDALTVLRAALDSGEEEARQIAAELANRLVAHGYRDFESCLNKQ